MRPSIVLTFLALVIFAFASAFAQEQNDAAVKPANSTLNKGLNSFAFNLYGTIKSKEGNLFLSPYNVSSAMALAYAGASSETLTQMSRAMGFPSSVQSLARSLSGLQKDITNSGGGVEISAANAAWGQKGFGFLDSYINTVKGGFGGDFQQVDFVGAPNDAAKTINSWVGGQTRGKIKQLLGPGMIKESTRLVLTSAIYFKGKWANRFAKEATQPMRFTQPSGEGDVPMMFQKGKFRYASSQRAQVLELPYEGNAISMLVILPKEIDGLPQEETGLSEEMLGEWGTGLRTQPAQEVQVYLPKFEITNIYELGRRLESLGMHNAFSPVDADFSGMNGQRNLFISEVVHKAFVDVDEQGTEAAAATGAVMGLTSALAGEPVVFRADHPFLFLIRHNASGTILFMGRVIEP